MCSASFDGVRPAAGAAAVASSAVQPVPAFPERAKVVALVAAIMLLCNADRVVMSVAVVPLAAQYGWSSSFVGIVQVDSLFHLCVLAKSRSEAKAPFFPKKLSSTFAGLSLNNKMCCLERSLHGHGSTKSTMHRHVNARRHEKTTSNTFWKHAELLK